MGARAAGANPDLTQNGVAAAIANAGGADVVGAGAAGGSGRPTVVVTPPANVRGDLAGDVVDPPRPRVVITSVPTNGGQRVRGTRGQKRTAWRDAQKVMIQMCCCLSCIESS